MAVLLLRVGFFFFLILPASARQTQGSLSVLQAAPQPAPESTAIHRLRDERHGGRLGDGVEFSQLQIGGKGRNEDDDGEEYPGEEGEGEEGESSGRASDDGREALNTRETEHEGGYEEENEGVPSTGAAATMAAPIGQEAFPLQLRGDSPQVGYADGQEVCSALGCARVAAGGAPKSPVTGCAKTMKCGGCDGLLEAEARCQAWKPSTRPDVILASGWYFTKHALTRSGAMELDINWDSNRNLDFKKCMPDLRQVTRSFKELQETGNVAPFLFHRMASVQLSVHQLPPEGMEDTGPKKLSFSIKFVDPQSSSLIGRVGQRQNQPMCSSAEATLPLVTLGKKTAMYGVGWLPIPNDLTIPITTKNFVIRMQCSGVESCNMNRIGVCARITCPATAAVAERQMATVQDAMSKPVGEGPVNQVASVASHASGDGVASRVIQASTGRFGAPMRSQVPLAYPGGSPYAHYRGGFPPGYPFYVRGQAAFHAPSAVLSGLTGSFLALIFF
ncbi:conserved hypothetical protein [Neospora caninum Liverpool]|uniref:Uncharacterized protein n=1 Tax=Neospora caninum (strain Liverpool) TaxID=572307 RepID=F0VM29_NEOCL|nr:conserved hypothetical protein [Neospora caninum Liverpool]CBZ54307.1 conserved hypothetical protein [Neospora caninum Liverpool]CEL69013.1 TPA: hypothetical protein BN1204_047390 [Neospora caninum Liverpool]|eukprot:XP_003884338.1 conserved hypothetical protein [Neospora caninum Liverpool]